MKGPGKILSGWVPERNQHVKRLRTEALSRRRVLPSMPFLLLILKLVARLMMRQYMLCESMNKIRSEASVVNYGRYFIGRMRGQKLDVLRRNHVS